MKQPLNRIFSALLALLLCVGLFALPASADELSGTCGDNLTWILENGILTISGTGKMMDFSADTVAPWLDYADQIQCVKVSDGITSIGDYAFYHCANLTSVSLPLSVKTLGQLAFAGCYNMVQIAVPGAESIGWGCFFDCTAITSITLPESLRVIEDKAFYHCSSLAGITIPAGVESFGNSVFCYCENLVYVKFYAQISTLPYWTFYGCDRLVELYLPSSVEVVEQDALSECPNLNYVFYNGLEVVEDEIDRQLSAKTAKKPSEISNIRVSYNQTDSATIVTKTEIDEGTTISATVTDPSGWDDVVDSVMDSLRSGQTPEVTVQVKDDLTMSEDALSDLADKNVNVTIHTSDNVSWEVIMNDQTSNSLDGSQNFSVSMRKNTSGVYADILGDAVSYTATLSSTTLNTTVKFPLGIENARQVATLYAIKNKTLEKLCSVIVDDEGMAAFCLAGTAAGEYILALNVPDINMEDVIIPQALAPSYNIDYSQSTLTDAQGNQYIITGTQNSLGFGLGTLTLIVVGVLVGSTVIVGAVMITVNKSRRKAESYPRKRP